jgi:hypothetical protein
MSHDPFSQNMILIFYMPIPYPFTIFWCLLNALVHKTHSISSPKNLVKILVPIYKMQEDSVKHAQ